MGISFCIPTVGRMEDLEKCLSSIEEQSFLDDEILVCQDGPLDEKVQELCQKYNAKYFWTSRKYGCYGHALRNLLQDWASKDWVMHLDDDDWLAQGAREGMEALFGGMEKPAPVLFKVRQHDGSVVWNAPVILMGNFSGQCLVCPNDKRKMGKWVGNVAGDFLHTVESIYNFGLHFWSELLVVETWTKEDRPEEAKKRHEAALSRDWEKAQAATFSEASDSLPLDAPGLSPLKETNV
jgi:glycosyltransferase involved in cell wall biosynthesis